MGCSNEIDEMLLLQPSHLLKRRPELTRFIDINLTSLLTICLAKLLANPKTLNASDENPSLARQVSSAIETEIRSEGNLVIVQEVAEWVAAEINWRALPLDFERIGSIGKRGDWRAEVGQRVEVAIFACRCAGMHALWLWGGAAVVSRYSRSWFARSGDCSYLGRGHLHDTRGLGDVVSSVWSRGNLWEMLVC